ncbi:MAG: hypothetical protein GEV03_25815 [Streptosporangiales bacterium]|nr:hypothetical protein [Streptosporangiales bacterium]
MGRVRYERDGAIGWVRLNRPEKLNALDAAGWVALREAVEEAGRDPGCGVVILTGEGRAFCAGDDVQEFLRLTDVETAREFFLEQMFPALEAIVRCEKPVITAVGGLAYGGGCEIALLSDITVAAEGATFCLPEGRLGVWATVFAGAAPSLVGVRTAKWLALSMRQLDAHGALRWGLAAEVVPDAELLDAARALAADILRAAPSAIAFTKKFLNRHLVEQGLRDVRHALETLVLYSMGSAEVAEGSAAFVEKREPRFRP